MILNFENIGNSFQIDLIKDKFEKDDETIC